MFNSYVSALIVGDTGHSEHQESLCARGLSVRDPTNAGIESASEPCVEKYELLHVSVTVLH